MTDKIERRAVREWVPISEMQVSPLAQRDMNPHWVNRLIAEFDPDQLGTPTVNRRDGAWYLIDGQHRIEALRGIGWGDQMIECDAYYGLTEEQEAEKFLQLNDRLGVGAFPKFKIGVTAGRAEEAAIDEIVRAAGLRVSTDRYGGSIKAVSALRRVYRYGPDVLTRTLRILSRAYGDAGYEAAILSGVGLLCARYDDSLDEERAVERLSNARGGAAGLRNKAEIIRRATGGAKYQCVAAAAVEIINSGRGGKKLPGWFRAADQNDETVTIATEASV